MPTNNTELELNPDVLKETGGAYSSLTDLYGVRVFMEAFTEQVQALTQQRQAQTEACRQSVFVSEHYIKTASNGYEALLFQTEAQTERIQAYDTVNGTKQTEIGIGVAVALLLVAGIYYVMHRLQKHR